jgi:hypothetical protein
MKDDERVIDGRVRTIVLPTKERIAKGDLDIEETDRGGVNIRAKRQFNDPLYYYARNGHITDLQKRAGLRFYILWYHGAMRSRYVLCRYGEERAIRYAVNSTPQDVETYLEMQEAYHFARKAIRGAKEKKIALEVCCEGRKAGMRGQMAWLRSALDDLVRHFGYVQ